MKKISLRESLIKIDKETDFEHNLTAMYESCSLTEDEKKKLVQYVDAYDIDSMNKMLDNKFASDISTAEDVAMIESYFEDGDISDEELASILGGDIKYDIPDGLETLEETEARLVNNNIDEAWEPEFSDEWRPEDIELWKSIDWKARNYEPYIDETNKIRGEVTAVGLPGGVRKGEAMFAKEFSANPIFAPKWKPITDPFENQGTNGWYMYDGVNHEDGYMMMTRTETQEVSDMLSEDIDDEQPYTREQLEQELKSLTNDFTRRMGEGKCGFKEEAVLSVDILEQHYEEVDMDKDGDWYIVTFAKPIVKESLNEDDNDGEAAPESEEGNEKETSSGNGFEELLHKLQQTNNYQSFVDQLKHLNDEQKKMFMKYFGKIDSTKPSVKKGGIAATGLKPTQSEIDWKKSLSYGLKQDCSYFFNPPVELGMPVLTYAGKYIIDGHHRWSQVFMFNPKATVSCVNFDYNQDGPIDVLKDFQTAVLAQTGEVKVGTAGTNIWNVDKETLTAYINENMSEACAESLIKAGVAKDKTSAVNYLVNNAMLLQQKVKPIEGAPDRVDMPQTDPAVINRAAQAITDMSEDVSLTNSPLSTAGPVPYAVKLLYMMDKFAMDVYDNEYWLMDGVPDGEFEETTADEAQQNYKDHEWLITDFDGEFDAHELENFVKSFRLATDNKNYDKAERDTIATEAESLIAEYLSANECLNEEDTNKIATKPNGDFLIASDSGKGFTAFNRDNVCIGGIDGDDAEEAKNKFLAGKLDEDFLTKDFGEEYLEEATDEDKQAVIEFAKDCKESGHPVEDYKEFASILRDEGITPSESLYTIYLDAYNGAE